MAQLPDLLLQRFDPLLINTRSTGPQPLIALRLTIPPLSVSVVQPIFGAIKPIASHWEA